MKILFLLILFTLIVANGLFANIVILKSGKELSGSIIAKVDESIFLKIGNNIEKIDFDIIKSIQNNGGQPVTKKWKRHENFKDEPYDLKNANTTYNANTVKQDKQARVERTANLQKNAHQYRTKINQFHLVSGLAFGYLAYSTFEDIADYNKTLNRYDDYDTDDLPPETKDAIKQAENPPGYG